MSEIFNQELTAILIAAAPLSELRGAIPLAITAFGFSAAKALVLSVVGNFLPVLPLLIGLERGAMFLGKRFKLCEMFFTWLFEYTRRHHRPHFERWGPLALFTLVAIPLPMTGAWAGAAAAFVFGIPFWRAVISIFFGIVAAGLIVTLATVGGISIFS